MKNTRPYRSIITCTVLLLILSLCGCSGPSIISPERNADELADALLASMQTMDPDQLQNCFAEPIDLDLSPESILKIFAGNVSSADGEDYQFISDYLADNASGIKGTVTAADWQDETGTLTMEFQYTDCTKIVDDTVGVYFQQALSSAMTSSEMTDDEVLKLFTDTLREKIGTSKTSEKKETLKLACVKTEDGWLLKNDETTVRAIGNIMSGGILSYVDKWTEIMDISRHNEEIEQN